MSKTEKNLMEAFAGDPRQTENILPLQKRLKRRDTSRSQSSLELLPRQRLFMP